MKISIIVTDFSEQLSSRYSDDHVMVCVRREKLS